MYPLDGRLVGGGGLVVGGGLVFEAFYLGADAGGEVGFRRAFVGWGGGLVVVVGVAFAGRAVGDVLGDFDPVIVVGLVW